MDQNEVMVGTFRLLKKKGLIISTRLVNHEKEKCYTGEMIGYM